MLVTSCIYYYYYYLCSSLLFVQEPLVGDIPSSPLPDISEDQFLTSPAAQKVGAGSRRNPFSNTQDMGHAGAFRTSAPEDSDFPVYRDTGASAYRQSTPASMSSRAIPASTNRPGHRM